MKLELFKISDLKLDPNNARKHSAKNLKAISGSFKEFDQLKNIVVDKNNVVIAGNGTVQSFIDDGKTEIWGVRSTMSDKKNKAFALADNRTAELAEWDAGTLGEQLQGLYEDGYPIADIGFDPGDYDIGDVDEKADVAIDRPIEFLLVIECDNETDQADLFEEFQERKLKCKIM